MNDKYILSQKSLNQLMIGIFIIITLMLITSIYVMNININAEQNAEQHRIIFKNLGITLANTSDYLTDEDKLQIENGIKVYGKEALNQAIEDFE